MATSARAGRGQRFGRRSDHAAARKSELVEPLLHQRALPGSGANQDRLFETAQFQKSAKGAEARLASPLGRADRIGQDDGRGAGCRRQIRSAFDARIRSAHRPRLHQVERFAGRDRFVLVDQADDVNAGTECERARCGSADLARADDRDQ